MEQNNTPEKPWYKKTWVIVVGVILLLAIVANIGKTKDKQTGSTEAAASEAPKAKQWTEVYSFQGNGMKKSPAFTLNGNNARLKYKYTAPGNIGMGMFAVYVVDEGKDIMKTGGIPEVMTNAENEESESAIQKSSGNYYLNVNSSGKWMVTVEEMR